MKTQHNNLLTELSKTEISKLTSQVKETVAIDATNHKTVFSAADLWNIQRTTRPRVQRRLFV